MIFYVVIHLKCTGIEEDILLLHGLLPLEIIIIASRFIS